jgi:hypothetical protein
MIHESYGDELDMTTDEEDTYHTPSRNFTLDKTSPKQEIKLNDKYDVSFSLILVVFLFRYFCLMRNSIEFSYQILFW